MMRLRKVLLRLPAKFVMFIYFFTQKLLQITVICPRLKRALVFKNFVFLFVVLIL